MLSLISKYHPFYQKENGERMEHGDVVTAVKSSSGTHPHSPDN